MDRRSTRLPETSVDFKELDKRLTSSFKERISSVDSYAVGDVGRTEAGLVDSLLESCSC